MEYSLVIKPLAEQDISESYEWYAEKQQDLGIDFLDEFERSIQLIKSNPLQYQIRYKDIHMVKLRRFPICIHYIIRKETIFVQAVLSTHRNPQIWSKRK